MLKFLLLLFCPAILFAQKTRIVSKSIDSTGIKQVYSILDFTSYQSQGKFVSDKDSFPEVMHGKFQAFNNDTLLVEGYYKFGMKDSIWKEYDHINRNLSGSGLYYYDLKDDWWVYYNLMGKAIKKYNHNSKETIILDSLLYNEYEDGEIFQFVEIPPRFIGGENELMRFLGANIHYPNYAKERNIQGRVYITFVIDKTGTVKNAKVLQGIGGGCDEEALRVVNLMSKNMWVPGYQNGQAVLVKYNMPVVFSLKN